MKASDRGEFIKALIKELEDHPDHMHWELVPREKALAGTKVLELVWSMRENETSSLGSFANTKPVSTCKEANRSLTSTIFKKKSPTLN